MDTPICPPAASFAWVTPDAPGGVAAAWVWGDEAEMLRLDACVGRGRAPLSDRESLRYGLLYEAAGQPADEVLLARPGAGRRVVSGHCGEAARAAVTRCLEGLGWVAGDAAAAGVGTGFLGAAVPGEHPDAEVAEAMLPMAVTERQAERLLSVRSGGCGLEEAMDWLRLRRVALLGPYNAGKSSLLNRWAGYERALVTEWPGGTLDPVTERLELNGLSVWVTDLPGLPIAGNRSSLAGADGAVWEKAWEQARAVLATADAVVLVIDGSRSTTIGEVAALRNAFHDWRAGRGKAAEDLPVLVVWTYTEGDEDILEFMTTKWRQWTGAMPHPMAAITLGDQNDTEWRKGLDWLYGRLL